MVQLYVSALVNLLNYIIMQVRNEEIQKITAHIPKELLKNAQKITHAGITETIKAGLKKIAVQEAYKNLLSLGGKCKININLNELREDKKHI